MDRRVDADFSLQRRYVAARLPGSYLRADGMYHDVVVWGVNWLMFAWLTTTALSAVIGGAFSTFGTTLQSLGQGATAAASRMAGEISLSGEDLQRELESVLRATGKPELSRARSSRLRNRPRMPPPRESP